MYNRLPSPVLSNKCPFEVLYHKTPNYSFLRTFRCACFPNLRPYNNHKLAFRSTQCTFLGYSLNHKGYKCLDNKGRIYISRDVIFDENFFPYSTQSVSSRPVSQIPSFSIDVPILSSHTQRPGLTNAINNPALPTLSTDPTCAAQVPQTSVVAPVCPVPAASGPSSSALQGCPVTAESGSPTSVDQPGTFPCAPAVEPTTTQPVALPVGPTNATPPVGSTNSHKMITR